MSDETTPNDLIPLSEACRRGPRPARGKKRHRSTLLRWILSGKLRGWKVKQHWYVSEAEVREFLRPVQADVPLIVEARDRIEAQQRERQADEVLRAAGIRR